MRRTTDSQKKAYRQIGARIARVLDWAELTQAMLAKKIGVSQALISQIIAGSRSPEKYLPKVAKASGVPLRYLLEGDSKYDRSPPGAHVKPKSPRQLNLDAALFKHLRRHATAAVDVPPSMILKILDSLRSRGFSEAVEVPPWILNKKRARVILLFLEEVEA